MLWILDPANRLIVDANAASTALLFQHLLMPADCSNQFQHVGASVNRAAGTGQLLDGGRADLEEERRCRREAAWRFELRAPLILDDCDPAHSPNRGFTHWRDPRAKHGHSREPGAA